MLMSLSSATRDGNGYALLENAILVPVTGRISAGPRDRH